MAQELTISERASTLDEKITVLRDQRQPATDEHIRTAIFHMQAKGLPEGSGVSPTEMLLAYRIALEGISHRAVAETTKRFIAGKVNRHNHSFMPNAPEFAVVAREIDRQMSADMSRLMDEKRTLDDLRDSSRKQPTSPESMSRIRELHLMFKSQYLADKQREGGRVDPDAVDDDRAERLKSILAMPVRSGATEDELRFASKMAARVGE
jgi:hypothetical protein